MNDDMLKTIRQVLREAELLTVFERAAIQLNNVGISWEDVLTASQQHKLSHIGDPYVINTINELRDLANGDNFTIEEREVALRGMSIEHTPILKRNLKSLGLRSDIHRFFVSPSRLDELKRIRMGRDSRPVVEFKTVGDICDLTAKELLCLKGFGPACLKHLQDRLSYFGLSLRKE